jgi:CheY-like chemotaxis protein
MKTLSILLVEDDPSNRDVVEVMLSRSGHRVLTCGNGVEALALCREETPPIDLILMDVQMPVMDGFETVRQIRAHAETRDLPIICLSAKAGEADQLAGLLAGADDYMTKPFVRRSLLDLIESVLTRKGMLPENQSISR